VRCPVRRSQKVHCPIWCWIAAYLLDTTVLDTVTVDNPCSLQELACHRARPAAGRALWLALMGNIGSADFVLGDPDQDNPLWTFDSCQMIFNLVGFFALRAARRPEW
jgi:hypothetical protein